MSRLRLYIAPSFSHKLYLRKAENSGTIQPVAPAAGGAGAGGGGGESAGGGAGGPRPGYEKCPFGGGAECSKANRGRKPAETHKVGGAALKNHLAYIQKQQAQGADTGLDENTLNSFLQTMGVQAAPAKKEKPGADPLTGETSEQVGADDPLTASPESPEPPEAAYRERFPGDSPDVAQKPARESLEQDLAAINADQAAKKELGSADTVIAKDPTAGDPEATGAAAPFSDPEATGAATPSSKEGRPRAEGRKDVVESKDDSFRNRAAERLNLSPSSDAVQKLSVVDSRADIAQVNYKKLTTGDSALSDAEAKTKLKDTYSEQELSIFLKDPEKKFDAIEAYESSDNKQDILDLASPGPADKDIPASAASETAPEAPSEEAPETTAVADTEEVVEVEAPTSGETIADRPYLADPDRRFEESVSSGEERASSYHENLPSSHEEALQAHENLVSQHENYSKEAKAHSENRKNQIKSGTDAIVNAQHEEALKKYKTQQKAHKTREKNRKEKHKAKQAELEEAHKAKQDELEEAHKAKIDAEYAAKFDAVKKEMIDAHAAAEPKEVKQIKSQTEMFKTDAWNKAEEAFRRGKDGHPGAAPKKPSLGKEPAKSADKSIRDKWKKKKKAYDAAMKMHPTVLRNHSNGRKEPVETYRAEYVEKLNRFDAAFDKFKKEKLKELNEPYEKYKKLKKEWQAKNPDKNKTNRNKMTAEIVSRIGKKDYSGFKREEFKREKFKPKTFDRKAPLKGDIDKKSVEAKVTAQVDKKLGPGPEVPAELRTAKGKLVDRGTLDKRRPRVPTEISTEKDRIAHQSKLNKMSQSISRAKDHLKNRNDLSDAERQVAHQAIQDLSFARNVKHLHTPDQIKAVNEAKQSLKDLKMHVAYKAPKDSGEVSRPPSTDLERAAVMSHNEKATALRDNLQAHLDSGTLSESESAKVTAALSGLEGLTDLETLPTKDQRTQLRQLNTIAGKHGKAIKEPKAARASRTAAQGRTATGGLNLRGAFASGQSRGRQLAQATTPEGAAQGVEAVTSAATSAAGGVVRTGHGLLRETRKDNKASSSVDQAEQASPRPAPAPEKVAVQKSIYIMNSKKKRYNNYFVTEGIH